MYSYMKSRAVANIWCNPQQDNQVIIAAKRITVREGELFSFPIMGTRIKLPSKDRRWHVFQVGQLHPTILNLLTRPFDWAVPTWKSFQEAVEHNDVFINVYNDKGVQLPLFRTYYMYTDSRALVIAVEDNPKLNVDFKNEQIRFRVYTNAYYQTTYADGLAEKTRVHSRHIYSIADINAVQVELARLKTLPGTVFCMINGHLHDTVDLLNTKVDDEVELYYDASVKEIFDFQVKNLMFFESTMDQCLKYLLHPPGKNNQIDFVDDLDIYVLKKDSERFVGRYLHRNQEETIRMVTHRDYSLKVDVFKVIAENLVKDLSLEGYDLQELYVRVYVRNSGMIRPLTYDRHRIFELYKLSHEQIEQAMLGLDSVMPYWTADALESSGYCRLMRESYRGIDIDLIERAYGYNGLTKAIGDAPIAVEDNFGVRVARLTMAYYKNSTVFEYDTAGRLLGFYYHVEGTNYYPRNTGCRLIEPVVGRGSDTPTLYEGVDLLTIPEDNSYRVYLCYLVDGIPNWQWRDVTGSDEYIIQNGKLRPSEGSVDKYFQVRTDEGFLAYTFDLEQVAGTFYFDFAEKIGNDLRLMRIPMGDLDIWFNGALLIEGVNCVVHWPRCYITDKQNIKPPPSGKQKITVRMTGFCNKDLTRNVPQEYGFVEHGVLSNNHRFDVRDDKVQQICLNGGVVARDAVTFSELHQGVSIVNAINGMPYRIKDIIVPIEEYGEEETYRLRDDALEIDQAVEDYMTRKLPQPDRPAVSAIPNRYVLTSPFFVHIVNDLLNKDFPMAELEEVLSDSRVMELCQPYEALLAFDPITEANQIEQRFVVIHPTQHFTTVELSLYSYRFLQRVVALYGRNLIQLSPHIVVSLGA